MQVPVDISEAAGSLQGGAVVAVGCDLVEVSRIAELVQSHTDRFLDRVFTVEEQSHGKDSKRYHEHLAARFAAKEAVLKAIGCGWAGGVAWTDVEVVRLPSGQPTVHLAGEAQVRAHEAGITGWRLSLTHTASAAAAVVVALGGPVAQGVPSAQAERQTQTHSPEGAR